MDEGARYFVPCLVIDRKRGHYEPVSFGLGNQPSPELLLRRDRVQLFTTLNEALKEQRATRKYCNDNKQTWGTKYEDHMIVAHLAGDAGRLAEASAELLAIVQQFVEVPLFQMPPPELIASAKAAIAKATNQPTR